MIGKKVSHAVKRSSLWTPNYIRVFLTNLFVSMIANGLPSVFTLFLLSRGGTDMDSGIATGCFYAVSLIARPITGWFVDNRGRRGVLLVSLVGLVLVPWAYILLPWIAGIILARTFHGTMEAICNTALTTASYDTLDPAHFSEGVGYFGFSNAIATAIGPAVWLALFKHFGALGLFAACSAVCAVGLLLMLSFGYLPMEKSEKRMRDEHFIDLLVEKDALPASVLAGINALMIGALTTYITVFFITSGDIVDAGRFFAVQAAGTFVSRFFVGKISDQYGEAPLVYSSAVFSAGGMLVTVTAASAFPVYVGAVFFGIGVGFTITGMQIMSVRIVRPERRGAATATYSCFWDICNAIGGLIAGVLVTLTDYKTMFILMTAVSPAYVLTYLFWGRRHGSAFRSRRAADTGETA